MLAQICALESWLKTTGGLAVNVKCLFEGEEEVGSTHLPRFLDRYPGAIAAEVAVMSDTRMLGPNRPVLTYGLRGSLAMEVQVRGLDHDLHSGNFGGAVPDRGALPDGGELSRRRWPRRRPSFL
jgi:acetylornithine deacetylase/succinyl-diaminopimelate desuccinylase-like protein